MNLPKVTQLGSCKEGIQTQVFLTPKPKLLVTTHYTISLNRDITLSNKKERRGGYLSYDLSK